MSEIEFLDDISGSKARLATVQGTKNDRPEFPYKMIHHATSLEPF